MTLRRSVRWVTKVMLLSCLPAAVHAQDGRATFAARLDPADARSGERARIVVTATMQPGWHIYALAWPGATVVPTSIALESGASLAPDGPPVQPKPTMRPDPATKAHIPTFEGAVAFGLPVRVSAGSPGSRTASVRVRYQACDEKVCLLPVSETVPVTFAVSAGPPRPEYAGAQTAVPAQPAQPSAGVSASGGSAGDSTTQGIQEAKQRGLLSFLWISLVAGLAAVLTPCVFPMIPITVSFFSKQKKDGGRTEIRAPLAYCLGIITTFTGLGVLVTLVFGAAGVQLLAASPWLNAGLAVLFVVLAANLFGVFEIALPGWLVSRAHAGAGRTGLLGPLFMGLTFTLTSFTCTFPFAGTLLASAAAGGGLAYPLVGMLAFSTAFAAPFFLLAMFPQYLDRLPQSGAWLASVKAFMGFIELAAAAKFASNVDMAWELRVLTRPIFLAVWAGILVVAALYLVGWLRLPHDPPTVAIGWRRRLLGILTAAAGVYCLAAMEGAPLGQLEAFPPPANYGRMAAARPGAVEWIERYEDAVTLARAQNRAMFVNFTGATCVNCREMEANVLPSPDVARELRNFIPVELYTDRARADDRKNQRLQLDLIKSTAQPVYAAISPEGKVITAQQGRSSAEEFAKFVRDAHQSATRMGLK